MDLNWPSDPPDVPVFKEESSASTVKRLMEGDVEVNTVSLSGENPRGKVPRGNHINLNPRRAWGDLTWPASLQKRWWLGLSLHVTMMRSRRLSPRSFLESRKFLPD